MDLYAVMTQYHHIQAIDSKPLDFYPWKSTRKYFLKYLEEIHCSMSQIPEINYYSDAEYKAHNPGIFLHDQRSA